MRKETHTRRLLILCRFHFSTMNTLIQCFCETEEKNNWGRMGENLDRGRQKEFPETRPSSFDCTTHPSECFSEYTVPWVQSPVIGLYWTPDGGRYDHSNDHSPSSRRGQLRTLLTDGPVMELTSEDSLGLSPRGSIQHIDYSTSFPTPAFTTHVEDLTREFSFHCSTKGNWGKDDRPYVTLTTPLDWTWHS